MFLTTPYGQFEISTTLKEGFCSCFNPFIFPASFYWFVCHISFFRVCLPQWWYTLQMYEYQGKIGMHCWSLVLCYIFDNLGTGACLELLITQFLIIKLMCYIASSFFLLIRCTTRPPKYVHIILFYTSRLIVSRWQWYLDVAFLGTVTLLLLATQHSFIYLQFGILNHFYADRSTALANRWHTDPHPSVHFYSTNYCGSFLPTFFYMSLFLSQLIIRFDNDTIGEVLTLS
jgi:hypothetical protein